MKEDTRKKIRETLSGLPERGNLLPFLELIKDQKLVSDIREFGVGFMVGYAYASGIGIVLAERVHFGDLRRISEEEKSMVISMVMEEFVKFRERVERELGR